jgi:high-affinity nickel-transport protein
VIDLLSSSAFAGAVVFGFRHGFDWDHIAALTDLTGSQTSSRRSMWLATLYALGHAAMVLVLGVVAILFAEQLPGSVDRVMERFVGATLVALGVWMAWTAVRTGAAPPLRSRWMLLIDGLRRIVLRRGPAIESIVVEHSHSHDHDHHMHEHRHEHDALVDVGPGGGSTEVVVEHRHLHRHVAVVPRDPFMTYGGWSSLGVGALHGVGAETPTQVLVLAAAAHASGRPTSIGLLACFVAGLLASNSLVAAASTFGFSRVADNRVVMAVLAAVTVAFSLSVGSLLLLGDGAALPRMLGGS